MYATIAHTNGLIINGIINVGFNTIGAPKIIGSLILKHAGRNAVLPRFLAYADFDLNAIRIARPIVHPAPPIQINH